MNVCFKEKSMIDLKKFTECCKRAEIQKFIEELPKECNFELTDYKLLLLN